MSKNADVGGVVKFKGSKVGNAGKRGANTRDGKHEENYGISSEKIKTSNGKNSTKNNNVGDTIEKFCSDGVATFEINIGSIIIYKNTKRVSKNSNNHQD